MSVFNSVLVGIDLLQSNGHDSSRFSLPVQEAIKHGLWLAEKASASVTFFAALSIPNETLRSPNAESDQLQWSGQRASMNLSIPPRGEV